MFLQKISQSLRSFGMTIVAKTGVFVQALIMTQSLYKGRFVRPAFCEVLLLDRVGKAKAPSLIILSAATNLVVLMNSGIGHFVQDAIT